jgi:hypothetical protein
MTSRRPFLFVVFVVCWFLLSCGVQDTPQVERSIDRKASVPDTVFTRFIVDDSFWQSTGPVAFLDSMTAAPLTHFVVKRLPDSSWYQLNAISILEEDTTSQRASGSYQLLRESSAPRPLAERTRGAAAKRLIRALRRGEL